MEEKKNLWSSYDEAAKKELHEINEKYKACLDAGKTERECVKLAVEMAKEAGYQEIKYMRYAWKKCLPCSVWAKNRFQTV